MTTARTSLRLLPFVVVAACATRPADPFLVAERALARHDLAKALRAYDGVPVDHMRYPEARAAAMAVERDMRESHELILQGLLLRGQWRDREALAVLQRVRSMWPDSAGVDVLIAATEQRLRLMGDDPGMGLAAAAAAPLSEAARPGEVPAPPPATADEAVSAPPTADASPPGALANRPGTDGDRSTPRAPAWPPGGDPVALGLVAAETNLCRGNLEAAVGDLLELAHRFPDEPRVAVRLVRLLHQRALLRYGEGTLAAAIDDWRRVLELAPEHPAAPAMLRIAETEGREQH